MVDFIVLERDAGGKPVPTFPHPAIVRGHQNTLNVLREGRGHRGMARAEQPRHGVVFYIRAPISGRRRRRRARSGGFGPPRCRPGNGGPSSGRLIWRSETATGEITLMASARQSGVRRIERPPGDRGYGNWLILPLAVAIGRLRFVNVWKVTEIGFHWPQARKNQ